ncbi:flagellar motor stator protein MotA [Anaerobacillus sp. MEB173]|uniref:flagellar motor stator protein MotA n=1 Tax=Anaerobacillus sp. MEB173 TaxID=3383345 RepID=UPI003F8F6F58
MDKTSIVGIILGVLAILFGMLAKGTSLGVLFNLAAILIIFAGTAAAILIAFPMKEIKKIPQLFKIIMTEQKVTEIKEIIPLFVDFATIARKEGLLALEDKVDTIEDSFLRQGMKMVLDGQDPNYIRDTMDEELMAMEDRHASGALIFSQAGTYAPTLGVLGAVIGLIAALGNLQDIEALGYSIAAAFVATLFGIFSGYVLWHPFANKLKRKSQQEIMVKRVMIEGVLSVQDGVAPRAIEDKLIVYVPYKERESSRAQAKQGEGVDA